MNRFIVALMAALLFSGFFGTVNANDRSQVMVIDEDVDCWDPQSGVYERTLPKGSLVSYIFDQKIDGGLQMVSISDGASCYVNELSVVFVPVADHDGDGVDYKNGSPTVDAFAYSTEAEDSSASAVVEPAVDETSTEDVASDVVPLTVDESDSQDFTDVSEDASVEFSEEANDLPQVEEPPIAAASSESEPASEIVSNGWPVVDRLPLTGNNPGEESLIWIFVELGNCILAFACIAVALFGVAIAVRVYDGHRFDRRYAGQKLKR